MNSSLEKHLPWLLLTVLQRYIKVSWGACSLISRLHVVLILIENFHETLLKQFFPITWQNNFFLTWFDWSRAFDFRICFEKHWLLSILMKNLHKTLHNNYVILPVKRLPSHSLCGWSGAFNFRVWHGKRNMAVKIPILILFCFFYLSDLKTIYFASCFCCGCNLF